MRVLSTQTAGGGECPLHHGYRRETTGELESLQGLHLPSHPEPGVSCTKGTGAGSLWPPLPSPVMVILIVKWTGFGIS